MLNEETKLAAPVQLKYGQFNHILLSTERGLRAENECRRKEKEKKRQKGGMKQK